jgi:hypothetical protein
MSNKKTECRHWLGCNFPHCYCQVDDSEKSDHVAHELRRTSIALSQYKDDLKDVEYENEIMRLGINQVIDKYTRLARVTDNIALQLGYSCVVEDMKNVLKVTTMTAEQILAESPPPQRWYSRAAMLCGSVLKSIKSFLTINH